MAQPNIPHRLDSQFLIGFCSDSFSDKYKNYVGDLCDVVLILRIRRFTLLLNADAGSRGNNAP